MAIFDLVINFVVLKKINLSLMNYVFCFYFT